MAKEVKVDEYEYIPRYQNMSYGEDTKMYNDLQDKMSELYCKWYGSAYGLNSGMVASLKEAIKKGKTTFTAWKREFEDNAYKGITGHTLTEERELKKKEKIKEQKLIDSVYSKILEAHITFTNTEFNTLNKLFKK